MSPIPLDFGAPERRRQVAAAIRRAVNDAVDSVGLGCAAGACGCEPPELREALDGKRGRRLPLEWATAWLRDGRTVAVRMVFGRPRGAGEYLTPRLTKAERNALERRREEKPRG